MPPDGGQVEVTVVNEERSMGGEVVEPLFNDVGGPGQRLDRVCGEELFQAAATPVTAPLGQVAEA